MKATFFLIAVIIWAGMMIIQTDSVTAIYKKMQVLRKNHYMQH
jgi:hypothetical protein